MRLCVKKPNSGARSRTLLVGYFLQDAVEDVGVVGVEVEREFFVLAALGFFLGDCLDDLAKRSHVGGVGFPCGVFHAVRGDVFAEQAVVILGPRGGAGGGGEGKREQESEDGVSHGGSARCASCRQYGRPRRRCQPNLRLCAYG